MSIDTLRRIFLWCALINYGVLVLWFCAFILAHDWIMGLHGRWFRLSVEAFDAAHYGGMAVYKVGILLLNLAPWLALRICGNGR
jgi:hypothetical protein